MVYRLSTAVSVCCSIRGRTVQYSEIGRWRMHVLRCQARHSHHIFISCIADCHAPVCKKVDDFAFQAGQSSAMCCSVSDSAVCFVLLQSIVLPMWCHSVDILCSKCHHCQQVILVFVSLQFVTQVYKCLGIVCVIVCMVLCCSSDRSQKP